ncbi:TetR/AcrR family transcriptional regulator [Phytoactinopolyspora halotolerans]|uniref:TetR/AcrR family transcriptional regulator n=1 Tax=Phytoactinopolyspora halotolerans TaxID=1981512 RepID=A0A6L9SH43_9ACTN|nr:TetR/AcrR family transcriptional regulator [Phytoactinopolyspora halotolerans]NEE04423.1 TetR/AcrR family transcriptional regulator [Phytoactinopolyspora halotolerans]
MPHPRGRPRSFDEAAALDRATRVFWAQGYEPTSMSDLTEAMGISLSSLYAAFGSKRELFRRVVEDYQARFGMDVPAMLAEAATARQGVSAMLHTAARTYTGSDHPPGCLIISAANNCGEESADVRADLRHRRKRNVAALADRIDTDIARGLVPQQTEPHALASFYAAVLQGMSQRAQDHATEADLQTIADTAMQAWPDAQAGTSGRAGR